MGIQLPDPLPTKEGLKPFIFGKTTLINTASRPTSNKRRIETFYTLRATSYKNFFQTHFQQKKD